MFNGLPIPGVELEALEGFAIELAKELLKRKDYVLVDGDWMTGRRGLVAIEDGSLAFIDVALDVSGGDGFEPPRKDRGLAERCAYRYLSSYEGADARVRFDSLQVKPVPNGKGFVKHIVNLYGQGMFNTDVHARRKS